MSAIDFTALAKNFNKYNGRVVVLKCGGETLKNTEYVQEIARQAAILKLLGCKPVVVHGGGPQINAALKLAGLEKKTDTDGMRITDSETMRITKEQLDDTNLSLCRDFNKVVTSNDLAVRFVGLSSHDAEVILGKKRGADNFTADVEAVSTARISRLINNTESLSIPVVNPVSRDVETDGAVNVNADSAAAAIANSLRARRLLMFSDVSKGVQDAQGNRIAELNEVLAHSLIADGVIEGGMRVKVETCLDVLQTGKVNGAVILHPKDIADEMLTDSGAPSGTLIRLSSPNMS